MSKAVILIVDDNPHVINTIVDILLANNEKYQFYQANNGELAYKVAIAKRPDLIITDWDMPKVDGITLIKNLKENRKTRDIPVIMATGIMLTSQNLKTALAAGASDYIRKPINEVELSARVCSMLLLSESLQKIKKQRNEIAQHADFLSVLINTIPQPVFHYDFEGYTKGYNKAFKNIAKGVNKDIKISEYLPKNIFDIHIEKDKELKKHGDLITYEQKTEYPNGEIRDIIYTKAVYCVTNTPTGIICLMTDITDLRNANREIVESQQKELAGITMRLIQSSEMNNKMIKDLESLKDYAKPGGQQIIRSMLSTHKQGASDKSWDEFDLRFKKVHKTFYTNLNNNFPNLTTNERKLCAFLKLEMTTKEIAAITFQNPQSIDMARYRLRKKLNLSKDENLTSYISKM